MASLRPQRVTVLALATAAVGAWFWERYCNAPGVTGFLQTRVLDLQQPFCGHTITRDCAHLAHRRLLGAAAGRRVQWPDERSAEADRAAREEAGVEVSIETGARFTSLPISDETKNALAEMDVRFMTEVQREAIPPILDGEDLIGKAQTGSGKTLAFVIPIAEAIRLLPSKPGGNIHAVILAPTRELVSQISAVAKGILKYHPKGHGVLSLMGSADIEAEVQVLASEQCDVIVATPGRFLDHLSRTPGFAEQVSELKVLVLDEADRLLDDFKTVIVNILKKLPPSSNRQGLFFSATFPQNVHVTAKMALKSAYKVIGAVSETDQTPSHIVQHYSIVPVETMTRRLWETVTNLLAGGRKEKIMVFFTTARVTQYFAELFRRAGVPVIDQHSRKNQAKRFSSATNFWEVDTGVFFTTDISARGMDYPDVTAVVHFGAPSSRDRYIHRLGRSGRMGKMGRSLLLLQDFEAGFLECLDSLDLEDTSIPEVPTDCPESLDQPLGSQLTGQAYKAWLGYYNFFTEDLGWTKAELVRQSIRFAGSLGALDEEGRPPAIKARTMKKMRLEEVADLLHIQTKLPYLEETDSYAGGKEVGDQEPVIFTGELGALFDQWDKEAQERGLPPLLPPRGFPAPKPLPKEGASRRQRKGIMRQEHQRKLQERMPTRRVKAPKEEKVPEAVLDARLEAVARVMASRDRGR